MFEEIIKAITETDSSGKEFAESFKNDGVAGKEFNDSFKSDGGSGEGFAEAFKKDTGSDKNAKETTDRFEKTESNKEQIEELRKDYIEDLKQNSEYPETIQDDKEPYEKISPEENAKVRDEFNDMNPDNEHNKEALIKKWEEENGKEWPRYEEDVYTHNGKLIRRAGDRYDAHHIHPITLGGKNEAGNITPIHAEKHYDKQGVHSSDSPYGKLEKTLNEEKSA